MTSINTKPEPKNLTEEVMKEIWEGEDKRNTWESLIWNEYPLADWEAKEIYARLKVTAEKIMEKLVPYK